MFCLSMLSLSYDRDVSEGTGSMCTIPEGKHSLPKSQLHLDRDMLDFKGTSQELALSDTVKLMAEESLSDETEDRCFTRAEAELQRESDSVSVNLEDGGEIREIRIELEPCKHLAELPSPDRGTINPSVHPNPDVREMMRTLEKMRCTGFAVPGSTAMPPQLKFEYFRPQDALCSLQTGGAGGVRG